MLSGSTLAAIPELAVVLGIMVIVHEFGHFAMAKLCGVRVEAFAIGFGKRLFGFIHNGTDYRLNLLPLGGYVKMAGELGFDNFDPSAIPGDTDPGELQNHPRWQRTLITLAGPIANFVLAFVLIAGVYMAHNEVFAFESQPVVADYISPNSPAARSGIQPGDRILFFDTVNNPTWADLEVRGMLNLNQSRPFSFLHNSQRVDSRIVLGTSADSDPDDFDFEKLGIVPVEQTSPVVIHTLLNDRPAALAGLQPGDRMLSVDGRTFHSVSAFSAYLQDQAGKPARLVIQRPAKDAADPRTFPVTVTPQLADTQTGKSWQIGFSAVPPPTVIEHYPLVKATEESWKFNKKNSLLLIDVLHRLFTRQVSVKALSSPIGIGVEVHQAFDLPGWLPIIQLMALISLNLGVFNLLPIPILDGGMILFLAIESLIRRDINPQVKERVYQVAFVCIVLFAAVVIFNDLTRFIPHHVKS